jgi:hypothetical protein
MGKLTIYLDEHTEKRARKAARLEGVSLSKWIASVLRAKTATAWPKEVLDLEGARPDFPEIQELRRGALPDARREEF